LVAFWALRRNLTGWLIDGVFRYTAQFEEQRLDEDSGMAGLPSVSERDRRTSHDAETVVRRKSGERKLVCHEDRIRRI